LGGDPLKSLIDGFPDALLPWFMEGACDRCG
jgi:hypothetical protein